MTQKTKRATKKRTSKSASKVAPKVRQKSAPRVAILMGSRSDWPVMEAAAKILDELKVAYDARVISAHRTPQRHHNYVTGAKSIEVFICGAGMAAHLAGVTAALTQKPVLGVPLESGLLGLDALLATVQMPGGIPVGTLGIGKHGAKNAALLSVAILALHDPQLAKQLASFRQRQTAAVPERP
ncbi:MAG: 5-(carboxyamino)imidazole ribonucleotide mutase [Alphaproteobacteria bacterium]